MMAEAECGVSHAKSKKRKMSDDPGTSQQKQGMPNKNIMGKRQLPSELLAEMIKWIPSEHLVWEKITDVHILPPKMDLDVAKPVSWVFDTFVTQRVRKIKKIEEQAWSREEKQNKERELHDMERQLWDEERRSREAELVRYVNRHHQEFIDEERQLQDSGRRLGDKGRKCRYMERKLRYSAHRFCNGTRELREEARRLRDQEPQLRDAAQQLWGKERRLWDIQRTAWDRVRSMWAQERAMLDQERAIWDFLID